MHEECDSVLHCWSCDEDEVQDPCYIRCFECGHVYGSPEDLQATWLREYPPLLPGDETPSQAPPAEEIFFCPLCIHDF